MPAENISPLTVADTLSSRVAEFKGNYLSETIQYDFIARLCTLEINAGAANCANRIADFPRLLTITTARIVRG